jgi:ABC-type antimicrobial peptide transport system permease subunit
MILLFFKNRKILIFILFFSLIFYIALITSTIFLNTYYFSLKAFSTEDTILIYNSNAASPITSSLPINLYDKIAEIKGVLAVSPEIVSLTQYNDNIIIVRGIDVTLFSKLQKIEILEGRNLNVKDGTVGIVGKKLSEKLNLQVNQSLLLHASLSNKILEIKIVGKFKTNTILDEEILVPLFVASWLNGYTSDYVSFFRVKIDYKETNMEEINKIINSKNVTEEQPKSTIDNLIYYLASRTGSSPPVKVVKSERGLENIIVNRLKINENVITGLIIVIIFLFSLILKNIVKFFFNEKEKEADIFFKLGWPKNKIVYIFLVYLLVLFNISFLIASLMFIYIKDYIQYLTNLTLFNYSINLGLDLNHFLIIYILLIALTVIYSLITKYE